MSDIRIVRKCNKCSKRYTAVANVDDRVLRFLCDDCRRSNSDYSEEYFVVDRGHRIGALPTSQ